MIILKLESIGRSLLSLTKDIKEIINPYYLVQGLINSSGWKIAKAFEDFCKVDSIYIPPHFSYRVKTYKRIITKNGKNLLEIGDQEKYFANSDEVSEFIHILEESEVYFYIEIDEGKLDKIRFIDNSIVRMGKIDNQFILSFTETGKMPNCFLNSNKTNSSINVPFNTCKTMSYRWVNNLGDSFNQSAEGSPRQLIPCLYNNFISSIWYENYELEQINLNKEFASKSPEEVYKEVKSIICLDRKDSIFTGHNEDGSPFKGDHIAIIPISFQFGINPSTNILWILFPKSISYESRQNIMMDIQEKFGGDFRNNSKLVRTINESYEFENYTPIIISNFYEKERPKRSGKKLCNLISKSLLKNGITDKVEIRFTRNFRTNLLQGNLKNDYGDKLIINPRSINLKFHKKVMGPILIGSGCYKGFGLFSPRKNE